MLKMVDGTGIIGVDMVCPLGGAASPPQPPNYDKVEMEGVGSLMLPNSLKAPLERVQLLGNSVQGENPAPDNPQEITSAGRKSKNLFDINYFKDKNNLQTIQCEGFSLLGITCNLKPNTEYTLSANLTEAKYNFNIANKTKRFSLTSAPSRTLVSNDDGTLYIGFYSTTADLINMDDFMQQYKNIQLEEGNKTDYEPYSDKYLLDVKVTGKNIFNKNAVKQGYELGAMLSDVETAKQGWFVSDFMPVKATTYQISGKKTGSGCKLYSKDKVFVKNIQAPFGGIKFDEGIAYFRINGEIKDLDKVQVEEGNQTTDYEPYQESQTLTLTSDHPITKWDKLVEQGGEYGWLYGSKIIDSYNSEPIDTEYMSSTGQLSIGATVLYRLKEPEFIPLSESEQTQLRSLHSYNGTTNIMVDSGEVPCGIKLTYRKEK